MLGRSKNMEHVNKKILKTMLLWTSRSVGGHQENLDSEGKLEKPK